MAYNSRLILPFALWPENPPSLSVSSLFINATSDELITGTYDGFIICWKIVSEHQKVNLKKKKNRLFFSLEIL
jgi:WD40 repeat protein